MLPYARLLALPALALMGALAAGCAAPLDDTDEDVREDEADVRVAPGCDAPTWEPSGPHTLGFIDADIECRMEYGAMSCERPRGRGGDLLPRSRHGFLAFPTTGGELRWQVVYTSEPVLCRATCAVYDSDYELISGDPFCDGGAVFQEGHYPITISTRRAALPGRLSPAWAFAWAYARQMLIEYPDDADGDWAAWPGVVLRAPEGGPVDKELALVGLTLRLDTDSPRLPHAITVAGAILRAHLSRKMAARLRDMALDSELDFYNRSRAGAVLVGLLSLDPTLSGQRTKQYIPGRYFYSPGEWFLMDGVTLAEEPEDRWPDIAAEAIVGRSVEADLRDTLRDSLESLRAGP